MPYTIMQNNNQGVGTTATPVTATFSTTPVTGNLLIGSVGNFTNTSQPVISDANGNWTLINSITTTLAQSLWLFVQVASANQPKTITGTLSGAKLGLNLYELGGSNKSLSPVDISGTGANATAGSTTSGSQPSITTTNPGDLIFMSMFGNGNMAPDSPTISAGTIQQINTNLVDAIYIPTSTGTFNPSFTWTVNTRAFQQLTTALLPGNVGDVVYNHVSVGNGMSRSEVAN